VARVVLDGVGEFGDHGFFAFEGLQEVAVFVEEHAGDADFGVFGASAFEHGLDFGFGEIVRGGTYVDDTKHGSGSVLRKVYAGGERIRNRR